MSIGKLKWLWLIPLVVYVSLIIISCIYWCVSCTILWAIVLGVIIKHWEIALVIFATVLIGVIGGLFSGFVSTFIINGTFVTDTLPFDWGFLFGSIYTLGLIIEKSNRKPYLWLWKKTKILVHKIFG